VRGARANVNGAGTVAKRKLHPENVQPPPAPAEPGNTRAITHGAYSERLVGPMSEQILDEVNRLCEGHPAAGPHFTAARGVLARKLARLVLVSAHLDDNHEGSPLTHRGGTLKAAELEMRLLGEVERSLEALGLTPSAAAKLGVDINRMRDLAGEMSKR
jgi:hypothetical protein